MSEGRLAKPQLRGLHVTRIKRQLGIMAILSVSVGLAFKYFIADPYERKVEDFYKTYDPEASLKRMNEAGLMTSYTPKNAAN